MAKGKISKHSRAARRATEELDPEVKDLRNLPRAEKTDLANILIRTAAKNEALLIAKIQKKQDKKKNGKSQVTKKMLENRLQNAINNTDKDRLERALNITNRLDGKISKSIARAKFVQNSRKANWEQTNSFIKINLTTATDKTEDKKEDDSVISGEEEVGEVEEITVTEKRKSINLFSLLSTDVDE